MDENNSDSFPRLQHVLSKICSIATLALYVVIAVLLMAAAVIGAFEAVGLLCSAVVTPSQLTITAALQSILMIIVIATLIDMVRSYLRIGRVLLRPILIAGITTTVRGLLVADLDFLDIIGVTVVILGLTAAMVFLSKEDKEFKLKNQSHNNSAEGSVSSAAEKDDDN